MLKEKLYESRMNPAFTERKAILGKSSQGRYGILKTVLLCVWGFLLSGASGGSGIPVCPAVTAALSPLNGLCIFIGCTASYIASRSLNGFLADIIAMPVIILVKWAAEYFLNKRTSREASAVIAGVLYTVSGTAAAFTDKITAAVVLAVIFRGVICGTAAYFAADCGEEYRKSGRISVTGEKSVGTAVIYVLSAAALCCVQTGNFCIGRATGIFVILAAGGRFGVGGGAVAGALTALGMILGEAGGAELTDMVRSSALMTCSGIIAGAFSVKSRTSAAVSFAVSMLVLIVFMERIQWAAALMTDTVAAAALYCLVPDRLYMKAVNGTVHSRSAVLEHYGNCIGFAASVLSDVKNSTARAAQVLAEKGKGTGNDEISAEACGKICSECRNNVFCCKGDMHRQKYTFPSALRILHSKGFITEKELPKALEGCTKKDELTSFLNDSYRCYAFEKHLYDLNRQLWENTCGQLSSAEDMLRSFGGFTADKVYDEMLSERVLAAIEKNGGRNASAAVFFDSSGHIFISCLYRGSLENTVESVTSQLSRITDRDIEPPVVFTEDGVTRIRWHDAPAFILETGKAVLCGEDEVSGDCAVTFPDGMGNIYYIISDGMGSGSRAALESGMAVSILSRLIKSGLGAAEAIKAVNLILLSKSSDEVFATVDLMCINLFTGRTDMFKLGAAPTLVRTGGSVKSIESRTLPAGIIDPAETDKRTLHLSDGDCAVMFSDGINDDSFPKIRELMLSDGYSPQRCADSVIEYDKSREKGHSDDRTIFVVKLHKI